MFDCWGSRVTTFYKGAEAAAIIARGRRPAPIETQAGIDSAWRSRVASFYKGAEAAAIVARASCQAPTIEAERAQALEAMRAKQAELERSARARPFDFADLNGRPEPEKWGPKYSKPVKRKSAFNDETNIPTNCASGQKRDFSAAKHRTKIRAEFAAKAEAEKRAWAAGQSKNSRGETIAQAYERAMAEKRERLRNPEAYAAKLEAEAKAARAFNAKVEAERLRLAKASRRVSRPRKLERAA